MDDLLNNIKKTAMSIYETINEEAIKGITRVPATLCDNVQVFVGSPDRHIIIDIKPQRQQLGGYLEYDHRYHTAQLTELIDTFCRFKVEEETLKYHPDRDGLHIAESPMIIKVCYDPSAGGDVWVGLDQCFGFGHPDET